jgi:hypothetical protein
MNETKLSDLIGLSELAEVLGVTKGEANAMRQRHGFPAPVVKLRMGPAWDRNQVLEWHAERSFPTGKHGFSRRVVCVDCAGELNLNPIVARGDDSTSLIFRCRNGCGETTVKIGWSYDSEAGFTTIVTATKEV